MNPIVEQFAAECHDILKKDSGAGGLEQVRQRLEKILNNEDVIKDCLGPDKDSPRNILYEDPELGFCIIAHVYKSASVRNPHDHGPSWAIYGQVEGVTEMTEFRLVEDPKDGLPGKAEAVKTYDLKPGMAITYEPGTLHAPVRKGPTRLIRIEGKNMDNVKRDSYEKVA
jgi:predicted metal-dependent enzyme (double-stranded beta helix superfamily)